MNQATTKLSPITVNTNLEEAAIYTLWTADNWLMNTSFVLHGLFSDIGKALDYAKEKALVNAYAHVLVYGGTLNNYEPTEQKLFSTEYSKHREQLIACL